MAKDFWWDPALWVSKSVWKRGGVWRGGMSPRHFCWWLGVLLLVPDPQWIPGCLGAHVACKMQFTLHTYSQASGPPGHPPGAVIPLTKPLMRRFEWWLLSDSIWCCCSLSIEACTQSLFLNSGCFPYVKILLCEVQCIVRYSINIIIYLGGNQNTWHTHGFLHMKKITIRSQSKFEFNPFVKILMGYFLPLTNLYNNMIHWDQLDRIIEQYCRWRMTFWDDCCVTEWRVMPFTCYRDPWKKTRSVEQEHEVTFGHVETFWNIALRHSDGAVE